MRRISITTDCLISSAIAPELLALRNDNGNFVKRTKRANSSSSIRADFNADKREDFAHLEPDGVHIKFNASPGRALDDACD